MDALHILITSASGGIGEATALRLAQPSPRYTVKTLVLHYNSNASKTQRITEEIRQLSPDIKVAWLQADLGSSDAVDQLHGEAVAAAGAPINVLFANAGTTGGRTYQRYIHASIISFLHQPQTASYTQIYILTHPHRLRPNRHPRIRPARGLRADLARKHPLDLPADTARGAGDDRGRVRARHLQLVRRGADGRRGGRALRVVKVRAARHAALPVPEAGGLGGHGQRRRPRAHRGDDDVARRRGGEQGAQG